MGGAARRLGGGVPLIQTECTYIGVNSDMGKGDPHGIRERCIGCKFGALIVPGFPHPLSETTRNGLSLRVARVETVEPGLLGFLAWCQLLHHLPGFPHRQAPA
jgi:hypothetical protein